MTRLGWDVTVVTDPDKAKLSPGANITPLLAKVSLFLPFLYIALTLLNDRV